MTAVLETMTPGQKAAATRRANREAQAERLANGIEFRNGNTWVEGRTCPTCLRADVEISEAQLPTTSPRFPQCVSCYAWSVRIEGARFGIVR